MGFRDGAYCKLWKLKTDRKFPDGQITISRKNKDTGEYVTDYQGFVSFVGAAAEKVVKLKEGARFQIKGCDVSRTYDKEKGREYINFRIFDLESQDEDKSQEQASTGTKAKKNDDNMSVAELEARLAEAKLRESGKAVADDLPDDLPF